MANEWENAPNELLAALAIQEDEDGISVSNWLVESLNFIKRMEMVKCSMATSCRTFHQLCLPKLHGNVNAHSVPYLQISHDGAFARDHSAHFPQATMRKKRKDENGLEDIPIPLVAPPEYINGFDCLDICFLNDQILSFLKNISPLLKNCTMKFATYLRNWQNEERRTALMRELLEILSGKIFTIEFIENNFDDFHQLFPEIIENGVKRILLEEFNNFELLLKWLTKKEQNVGTQKILNLKRNGLGNALLKQIKKEFLSAIHHSNFMIWQPNFGIEEFALENKKTGEILELFENARGQHLLARFPKGEGEQWKEEGQRKMWPNGNEENLTKIMMEIEIISNVPYLDSAWELLKEGIEKTLRKEKSSFETLHRYGYIMVLNRRSEVLYNGVVEIIREYLQKPIRKLLTKSIENNDEHFAEIFNNIWKDHNIAVKAIRDICMYLDRVYIPQAKIMPLYQIGMNMFGTEIVDFPPIKGHLKAKFGGNLAQAKGAIDDDLFEYLIDNFHGKFCNYSGHGPV